MKQFKRILSMVLAIALGFTVIPGVAPVYAVDVDEEPETTLVTVDVATASGTMNLTEEGTLDWFHGHKLDNIDRKGLPADGYQLIDYLTGRSNSGGRTLGQTKDQVWRYQTFTPQVSGKLTSVQVSMHIVGSPSDLVAKLVKMDTDHTELATCTVPASQIKEREVFALNFGDVTVEADTTYAVAISQKTLDQSNLYWWEQANSSCNAQAGKIKEDGSWVAENNVTCALKVEIGNSAGAGPVGIINFELVGEATMTTNLGDSPVTYSWSDGYPTTASSGNRTGGVIAYGNGTHLGEVTEEAGWRVTVPAGDGIRTLTVVSGVWDASAEIRIFANGDHENPIYTNTELSNPGGTATVLKYTLTVTPNTSIEVYGKLTRKGGVWGNMSIGGITLSETARIEGVSYVEMLKDSVDAAGVWLQDANLDEYYRTQLETAKNNAEAALTKGDALTEDEAFVLYTFLEAALQAVESSASASGSYANSYASGLTASFGWEGDKDAPIAWVDGTYRLRDNGNQYVTFGVTNLPAKSINWYNAEGYLPAFVSEYEKNGISYVVENFADWVEINGRAFEIAYSRVSAINNTEETMLLPKVSSNLIPLNETAKAGTRAINPGQTVVRDYCIGADRFGGSYAYPENDVIAAQGSFDEHYDHMKNYWNGRLENIIDIKEVPDEYSELIDAYKAGYIYMLIISDGYELHVGENGYDRVFDHDVIGMLASLVLSGHTEHFEDFAAYLKYDQYPDSQWKQSWPFALYLQKTGDAGPVLTYWDRTKTYTHTIQTDRRVYDANILDEDGNPASIMRTTNAIDSNGLWVIDNWAALFGLTTYSYLCERLQVLDPDNAAEYKTEYEWAQAEYASLVKSTEAVLKNTMEKYGFEYIPISMVVPNEMSERSDVRDGNWAAHYLFGRWNWDGYLFGAPQDSWLLDLTDATYDYVTTQKSAVFDSVYNMGGYPHGYFSSAYNAGYFSAALSGEKWRDGGIEAYLWMINNSMGGLYGWWEGVAYPSDSTVWDRDTSAGGGGSCQHMWGQSTATKVLIDALMAEKADGSVIIGRGIPKTWNVDGETVEVDNFLAGGKRVGFKMTTEGKLVTITLTGDWTVDASLELLALVDNIQSVSEGVTFDNATGKVAIPAGVTSVTITLKQSMDEIVADEAANADLEAALRKASTVSSNGIVSVTYAALVEAVEAGNDLLVNGGSIEAKNAAAEAIYAAIDALLNLRSYETLYDRVTGYAQSRDPSFGELTDERARYVVFPNETDMVLDAVEVYIKQDGSSSNMGDCVVSLYSLKEDGFTLDECLGYGQLAYKDLNMGGANIFDLNQKVELKAGAKYAIHFSMDHSNGQYGSYQFLTSGTADGYSLYKVLETGALVNESFLGVALMKFYSFEFDKTELDNLYVNAPVGVDADLLAKAEALLWSTEATQKEIDTVAAELQAASDAIELAILVQPESFAGALNATASFTVTVNRKDVTYQWFYQAVDSELWVKSGMDGATTDTLNVKMTTARLGQKYKVVVTDSRGAVVESRVVTLGQPAGPVITEQPVATPVAIGQTVTLNVVAEGEGLTYQWFYSTKGKFWTKSSLSGNNTDALNIKLNATRIGQMYKVVVTDAYGNTVESEVVTLSTITGPVIVTQPADVVVTVGEQVSFTVVAQGEGLTYQWKYSKDGEKWLNSNMEGSDGATLTMTAKAERIGQMYKVVVTDVNGNTVESDVATILGA